MSLQPDGRYMNCCSALPSRQNGMEGGGVKLASVHAYILVRLLSAPLNYLPFLRFGACAMYVMQL